MLIPKYIPLKPNMPVGEINITAPFAAVVVINGKVTDDWRNIISEWLVDKGCEYMMAHGDDCSLWDDSVDWANLAVYDYAEIPDGKSVVTTWHENERLSDVFYFAKMCALPFSPNIKNIIILDIIDSPREAQILLKYKQANEG